MSAAVPLLPKVSLPDFDELLQQEQAWLPVATYLCRHHHIPSHHVVFHKNGSNVVAAVNGAFILKLFPPFHLHQYQAEKATLEQLQGKALPAQIPQLLHHGQLEAWTYIIMTKLEGETLEQVWPDLTPANKLTIMQEIGRLMAKVHALETSPAQAQLVDWPSFIRRQAEGCYMRHQRLRLAPHLLSGIPAYLEESLPFLETPSSFVLLTGEYTPGNLLLRKQAGNWHLTGLIDFADSMTGPFEYDLLGPALFLAAGDKDLRRALFLAYGYRPEALTENLSKKLMLYTLLHRYSNLQVQVRLKNWEEQVDNLRELEQLLWEW